jgi:hypothetical protein
MIKYIYGENVGMAEKGSLVRAFQVYLEHFEQS